MICRCFEKKFAKNMAKATTISCSASEALAYARAISVLGGMSLLTVVMTLVKNILKVASYTATSERGRLAISAAHLRVMLRYSASSRNYIAIVREM